MRTLVLDQGYQPHRIVSWQKAVCLLFTDKVDIVEEYEDVVRSVSLAIRMPAVIRLRKGARRRQRTIKFSRLNVCMRDGFVCQYCGEKSPMRDLTYDHVLPRSRGGRTTWENIVTACRQCNESKGDKTPEEAGMTLRQKPRKPTWLPTGTFYVDATHVPDPWKAWVAWAMPSA